MKKNDLMGLLVYALMLGGVAIVVFSIIRPAFSNETYSKVLPMNGIVFMILAFAAGIVLTALLLELGHLLGAKLGGYKVSSWNCLGLRFKRNNEGKMKIGFGGFDGLTGETKVVPNDIKKSNPRRIVYTPMIFFLLEVIGCVIWCSVSLAKSEGGEYSAYWSYIFAVVVLTTACAIFFYDIFPATLDSKNDGRMLTILTSQTNVEAYNRILVNEDLVARGEPVEGDLVYEDVTNFTIMMNNTIMFDCIKKGDYEKALGILDLTIACKEKVSATNYNEATAIKTALILLTRPEEEAKQFYIDLPLEQKKYFVGLNSNACRAAYILVSAIVEDAPGEAEIALRNCDVGYRVKNGEKLSAAEDLVVLAVKKAYEKHPDWDLSEYAFPKPGSEEKPVAPEEPEKAPEEPKDE